jgi:RNA polymerase sigma factor (sigma-70 family)
MAENEIILLERFVKGGDAEAFTQIVQRHAGLVYGASLRVVEDQSRAADVVQETFLQFLRDAGKITGSVPSWLHRVATRKALTAIRTDSRRKRREAKYAADKPLKTTRWEDISIHVDQGLDELDDETRQILVRHFFQGQTMTDIAEQVGISQPTVSRRVESGVSGLREMLRKRGIIVAAAAVGSLLTQNAAQAAPAIVLKELGKIALVGGSAAASSIGSSAAASGAGAKVAAAGALTTVKAKLITAAAVAVVGVGGVVTYKQVTGPAEQPKSPAGVTRPVAQSKPKTSAAPVQTKQPARTARTVTAVTPEEPAVGTVSAAPDEPTPAATSSPDESATTTTSTRTARRGYGMGAYYGGSRVATSAEQPESQDDEQDDPNDTETRERRARSGRRRTRR